MFSAFFNRRTRLGVLLEPYRITRMRHVSRHAVDCSYWAQLYGWECDCK